MPGEDGNIPGEHEEENGADNTAPLDPRCPATPYRRRMRTLVNDLKDIRDAGYTASSRDHAITKAKFKGMFLTLTSTFDKFEQTYDDLCDLIKDNGEFVVTQEDHDLRARGKRYMHESLTYNAMFEETEKKISISDTTAMTAAGYSRNRLPNLELPYFDGDRTKWPRFKDTFFSRVIEDKILSDVDRFHFLSRCLKGKAAAVIAHIPVTDNTFYIAWDLLVETYDNKRLLAAAHLDRLLDLKPLSQSPSTEVLSNTVASLSESVAAFKLINIPDREEFIYFHLARRCLDVQTREDFERQNKEPFPSFSSLTNFLRSRCVASELATGISGFTNSKELNEDKRKQQRQSKYPRRSDKPRGQVTLTTNSRLSTPDNSTLASGSTPTDVPKSKTKCHICKEYHSLMNCVKFAAATVSERMELLRTWKGCRNCLLLSHTTNNCVSKYRCRYCHGKHHSMLHNLPAQKDKPEEKVVSAPALHTNTSKNINVMLGTAECNLLDSDGRGKRIRLVLDSGSTTSYVRTEVAQSLGLKIEKHSSNICGIGGIPFKGYKGRTVCTISPISSPATNLTTTAIVADTIVPPLPGFAVPTEVRDKLSSYSLADSDYYTTKPIDFLLGCDLYCDVVNGGILTVGKGLPRLMSTIFGHAVIGRIRDAAEATLISTLHASTDTSTLDTIQHELLKFWELEEPPNVKIQDPEELRCEQIFKATHSRLPDGRYMVRLPFRHDDPQIVGTRGMAMRRLEHLESKLARNSNLKSKYDEFMQEYIDLNHMQLATQPGLVFIPHHCVVKPVENDIKIRVVFDAAARTSSGSLNDALLVGPKLQNSLPLILLNFRRHAYVFTADAVKMYRQILVHPDDRVYQHILWRFNPAEAVQDYELMTVSYGQASAPYLALRVLRQLVEDDGQEFPLAAAALLNDSYIDDVATGANSLEDALELLRQLITLLSMGGFSLSKWSSNHPDILAACRQNDPVGTLSMDESIPLQADDESNIKILGMQWNPHSDVFSYKIVVPRDACTKRGVLSAIAKIYDPLGYLGPTVVLAKELIQEAWKRQLTWDQEFPSDMRTRWLSFTEQLPELENIKIPRWIVPSDGPYDILIFADASERAYCAAAYLRSCEGSESQMHLLIAKTKLAPVKFTSVPRLELCAALLAARVYQSIQPFCEKLSSAPSVYFFSDSMIVLSWLTTPYHLLKTFVANRIVQIRDLTSGGKWRHVASSDNPSDLGSRGVPAADLINSELWFHGPDWARSEPAKWPITPCSPMLNVPELKALPPAPTLVTAKPQHPLLDLIASHSSLSKLLRVLAYILRFVERLKGTSSSPEKSKIIRLWEIRRATRFAVLIVQRHEFFNDHDPTEKDIPKHLQSLHPFLDKSGLLLVGGRLSNSNLPYDTRHPMLLPPKAHLTTLIIEKYHRQTLHSGPSLLLASLRWDFWIPNARNTVRSITRKCITCRKHDAKPVQPSMGDLPADRFQDSHPFLHVGIDYAGPFIIRDSLRRKANTSKAYLCLFVCLSTKALHLELVSSLSTASFLACLDRFVGRRGKPAKIFSDNGTNFIGAAHQMKEFFAWIRSEVTKNAIQEHAVSKEIEWSFIPPHAPSFGGLWEAGVKSVKRLMRCVYGDNVFTFEELSTLLINIEAILNSRPLCPMSNDPNDLSYLTPGHFLIGMPLTSVPEPSLLDVSENRLTRWQAVAKKSQHFWQRWRREYLTTLQERTKWRDPAYNLQIGDLVIIKADNVPRLHWPLGRVTRVFPGSDGVVRVAEVQTASSVFRRPCTKLVPLFFPESTASTTI